MSSDINFHIIKSLALVLVQEAEEVEDEWALKQLISLYKLFPAFQEHLSSPLMLLELNQTGYYRRSCTSFPEFVVRHQLKVDYSVVLFSGKQALEYAIREDDYKVAEMTRKQGGIRGGKALKAIKCKSWKILENSAATFDGKTVDIIKASGGVVTIPIGTRQELLCVGAGVVIDYNVNFEAEKQFWHLRESWQKAILSGWFAFIDEPKLVELINHEKIMSVPGIRDIMKEVAIKDDRAEVVELLIKHGVISDDGDRSMFLSGGYALLSHGIEKGYITPEQALDYLLFDLITSGPYDRNSISLVSFLERTNGKFSRQQYGKLALQLLSNMEGRDNGDELDEPLGILWVANRDKLSKETKDLLSVLNYSYILTNGIVPH